jgi:hypothetical protein
MLFASSIAAIFIVYLKEPFRVRVNGWHFSGYSFVATDKRVTRPLGRNPSYQITFLLKLVNVSIKTVVV